MTWRLRTVTITWHCPACLLEGEIRLPGCAPHFRELTANQRAAVAADVAEKHQQAHFTRSRGQAPGCPAQPTWTL